MLRAVLFLLGVFATSACQAQLPLAPRAQASIADPKMVIEDRGAVVEILPSLRAAPARPGVATAQSTRVFSAGAASKFSPDSMGVVFNHAMQARGVISGEIAFKMKPTLTATPQDFPSSDYPGLAKVTNPNVYIVVAKTPAEYVAVYQKLKARSDLEWVEPVVDYSGGPAGGSVSK